jgi:RimJ/RimL family protein N-acetyltransferase
MPRTPFVGETVSLRPFEPDDVKALQEYLNHPDLMGRRHVPWGLPEFLPLIEPQVHSILERWAAEERSVVLAIDAHIQKQAWGLSGESSQVSVLVGHAEFSWGWDPHAPSVSVVIDPEHQRKGYGSEALFLLLQHLFAFTPAHNVSCWIADWNEAALGFAAANGFQSAGHMRRAGLYEGRAFDLVITDILRPEFQQRAAERLAARGQVQN